MRSQERVKRNVRLKNFIITVLVIAFFVAIILGYYNMLVAEARKGIIRDGEISARQVETQFNEYLATCVDALKLTAYTLDGMVEEDRPGDEILDYLVVQSTAVINAIFENTMGVYGYINGGYYDGAGWIPDEGFEPKTRPWYTEAAANHGAVTLVDPYLDLQSNTVMMSLSKMLKDGDSVISMDIYLDRIQEITEDAVASGASDIELILDTRGMVVAHSDFGEVGKNYNEERGTFAAALMEHLSENDEDYFEFYYGDSHFIAYQAMLQNDWRCLSVKDATNVFKPLKTILSVTVAVVTVVIFILYAFLTSYNQNTRTIENLTEEAMLDKLTGFLNKAGVAARMPELCRTETGMLAILDLDSFKLVNDLYGHDTGDRVLVSFSNIVRQNTRADDVLCRIGGDEFLIFCRNVTDVKVIAGLAKRLNEQLAAECRRMMGPDFVIPVGVSVGAVAVPKQGTDYRSLFPLADKALYQVKQNGKHGYAVYDASLSADGADQGLDGELARITQILGERGEPGSALWLGQDDFTSVYRFMLRSMKRSGGCAEKLLFLLSGGDDETALPDLADRFGAVLRDVLRAQDAIFQSKPAEFLVLLPGCEDAERVTQRILDAWQETPHHERCTLTYVSEPVRFRGSSEAKRSGNA